IGRRFELAIIPAEAVDAELDGSVARLNDAGATYAGHAAHRRHARCHARLEPADRTGAFRCRIGEGPGAAARVPFTASRTLPGIAGPQGKAGVIAAGAVEADLT